MEQPWFQLNPNVYDQSWWLYSDIIDDACCHTIKTDNDISCYLILQQCNQAGHYWRVSTWYKNDPNRYLSILYESNWKFQKELTEMKENEIVHLRTNRDIRFKVHYSKFTNNEDQREYFKILERVEEDKTCPV
jgi:hypothetical protein